MSGSIHAMQTAYTHGRRGTLSVYVPFATHIEILQSFCESVPQAWQEAQLRRDASSIPNNTSDKYHITIAGPQDCYKRDLSDWLDISVCAEDIIILGLGRQKNCMFAVVHSTLLSSVRISMGLKPANFHITLGVLEKDTHGVDKSKTVLEKSCADIYDSSALLCVRTGSSKTANSYISRSIAHNLSVIKSRWHMHNTVERRALLLQLESAALNLARAIPTAEIAKSESALKIANAWRSHVVSRALRAAMIRCASRAEIAAIESELKILDAVETLYLQTRRAVINIGDDKMSEEIYLSDDDKHTLHLALVELSTENTPYEKDDHRMAWLARAGLSYAQSVKCAWGRNDAGLLTMVRLPLNMVPVQAFGYTLWGSGCPSESSIKAVMELDVVRVVTLMEDPLPEEIQRSGSNVNARANYHHYPIPDRHTPANLEDLIVAARCVQRGLMMRTTLPNGDLQSGRVLVHCLGGKGRTVLVLAALLMLERDMSPSEALLQVKSGGRRVLVTEPQITMLKRLYGVLNLSPGSMVNGRAIKSQKVPSCVPKIIITCGLPGAGKSTFSLTLLENYPDAVCHVNQDELGREAAEEAWSRGTFSGSSDTRITVLDKCLATKKERAESMSGVGVSPSDVVCIYFSRNTVSCTERASARKAHVGNVSGPRAVRVVEAMTQKFEIPQEIEGFKQIINVCDDKDVEDLLKVWGCSTMPAVEDAGSQVGADDRPGISVVPFPRTRHLLDLGAATSDDVTTSDGEGWLRSFHSKTISSADGRKHPNNSAGVKGTAYGADSSPSTEASSSSGDVEVTASIPEVSVTVEEKIDGANMGFRLGDDGYSIIAQNRSHFVCSADHAQFRKLTKWQMDHITGLRHVLRDRNTVLYGEWVYATHSVSYDALPSYFIAFDMRCLLTNTFVSRYELERVLHGTGVPVTPSLLYKPLQEVSLQAITQLVNRRSTYDSASRSEGVYVRIQQQGLTVGRAKIVRRGFIAGNARWDVGPLQQNGIQWE